MFASETGPPEGASSGRNDNVYFFSEAVRSPFVLTGVAVYEFIINGDVRPLFKYGTAAIYIGLAGLFVSVLRQRLIARKTDKYKDVEI